MRKMMHDSNPLSKNEFYKKADVGDSDFSYEELGQPPAPKAEEPRGDFWVKFTFESPEEAQRWVKEQHPLEPKVEGASVTSATESQNMDEAKEYVTEMVKAWTQGYSMEDNSTFKPGTSPTFQILPPTERAKKEVPKLEEPKPKKEESEPKPKKEEQPKKEGKYPHVDKVNGNPGAYWIPNISGFEASALEAIKTGGTVFKGSVSFQGDDWSDQGDLEIFLNRGTHNRLHILINPQGFIDEVARVAAKYDAAKSEFEGHVFHPRRCIPFILENIGKRLVDVLGSKLQDIGIKSGIDFKMKDSSPYASAVGDGRALLDQMSRSLSEKSKEEVKAPKKKKLDTETILEKFFDDLPTSVWESHVSKTLGIKTKTVSLLPEKYSPIKEILNELSLPMGKVGPYQFEKRPDGNLLVIDTSSYSYSGWVGPELTRLSELLGDELSKNASATIAGLTNRFPFLKVK